MLAGYKPTPVADAMHENAVLRPATHAVMLVWVSVEAAVPPQTVPPVIIERNDIYSSTDDGLKSTRQKATSYD